MKDLIEKYGFKNKHSNFYQSSQNGYDFNVQIFMDTKDVMFSVENKKHQCSFIELKIKNINEQVFLKIFLVLLKRIEPEAHFGSINLFKGFKFSNN